MSEDRFLNIETTLAFQDDLLTALNKTVADQANQIVALQKRTEMLMGALQDLTELMMAANIIDEKPPHY